MYKRANEASLFCASDHVKYLRFIVNIVMRSLLISFSAEMIDFHKKVFSLLLLGLYIMDRAVASDSGGLADLAKILGQLAGGDDCVFRCPKGYKPLANPNHKPSSNGCGSMGIKLDTTHFSGFTRCCDIHDICYDTCNNDRTQCDEDFKSCLDNECLLTGLGNRLPKEQLDACQSSADLLYSGTYALGCMAYKEAQRHACLCNGRTLTKKEMEDLEREEEL